MTNTLSMWQDTPMTGTLSVWQDTPDDRGKTLSSSITVFINVEDKGDAPPRWTLPPMAKSVDENTAKVDIKTCDPLIKPRRMKCFLFGKGKMLGWPRGQEKVTPRLVIDYAGGQVAYQSIWELSEITMGSFRYYLNSIWIYWRKVLTQKSPCDVK